MLRKKRPVTPQPKVSPKNARKGSISPA
jgi:hypothetical protein